MAQARAILAEHSLKNSPRTLLFSHAMAAFDREWSIIQDSSCFYSALFCFEQRCGSCCDPCCFCQGKCCCVKALSTSGKSCVGEKGCCFRICKTCCCISAVSTSNLAIGCCDTFLCGKPYGEDYAIQDASINFMK